MQRNQAKNLQFIVDKLKVAEQMDEYVYGAFKLSNKSSQRQDLEGWIAILQLDFGSRLVNVVDLKGTLFANDRDGTVADVLGTLSQKLA